MPQVTERCQQAIFLRVRVHDTQSYAYNLVVGWKSDGCRVVLEND